MSDTTQQSGLLFAGTFYVSFQDATGNFLPAVQIETDKFSVTTPADKKQAISKKRENYGAAHTTGFVGKPTEFEMAFTEVTRALLAVQLSGELNAITTAGGAFADVSVVAALGAWVDVGHQRGQLRMVVLDAADGLPVVLERDVATGEAVAAGVHFGLAQVVDQLQHLLAHLVAVQDPTLVAAITPRGLEHRERQHHDECQGQGGHHQHTAR